MPIFEYICKQCDHQFEALVYGQQKAECPKCHGSKLAPQLSVFAVSAKGSFGRAGTVNRGLWLLWRPARAGLLFTPELSRARSGPILLSIYYGKQLAV